MTIYDVDEGKHLTAGERKVIKEMLRRGLDHAKAGRTIYELFRHEARVRVTITRNETNAFGKLAPDTHTAWFSVQG